MTIQKSAFKNDKSCTHMFYCKCLTIANHALGQEISWTINVPLKFSDHFVMVEIRVSFEGTDV